MARYLYLGVIFSASLSLAGCGSDGTEEVREFVKNAHSDKKPRIEPLPEIKTHESFTYAATNLPDPFAPFNLRAAAGKGGAAGSGPRPDTNRRKEPLEEYPLDSLKMAGTLARGKLSWAVIMAPDGTVHRVKIGDHMGQNYGMVTKITDDKINLIELVQGPLGDWVERESSVSLTE
jgi:type IV pilus assembly protein PilP